MYEIIKIAPLSEAKIAKEFGISRTFVHQWSAGERPIPNKYKEGLYKLLMDSLLETIEEKREGIKALEESFAKERCSNPK